MPESIRIPIQEQSQTSDARRIARGTASKLGFDEILIEQVAIVVTEACTNLLKHAGGGELLLRATDDDSKEAAGLELLVLDKGPGMANLEQCLRDGFSTGGSPGQGLGAIKRLSSAADFYSAGGGGAAILARWDPSPERRAAIRAGDLEPLHVGAVNVPKYGQDVCGDSWGVEQSEDGVTVLLADGLGHGMEAKVASMEAVRILRMNPDLAPGSLAERVHQALRSTRGAALGISRINRRNRTVRFAGIGNISAHLYAGAKPGPRMISVHGTAGFQSAKIREFEYPWTDNGMLLMFSDGLGSQTSIDAYPGLALRDPALIAGVVYRDFARGNDDATAVVAKAA